MFLERGKRIFQFFCSIKKRELSTLFFLKKKKEKKKTVSTVENKTMYLHSKWLLESET